MMKDLTPDKMADFSAWEKDNEPSATDLTITAEEFDKKFDNGEDITNMLDMHNIDVFTSRNSHFPEEMQESLNKKRKESKDE